MNQVIKRAITFFVLISVTVSSLGMIGTVPVMAQASSPASSASPAQQETTETPTVETAVESTSLPAKTEPASVTPTTEPASATPTSEPATDTATPEQATATPTNGPATATPTPENTFRTPTVELTLTSTPTSTPQNPVISASSSSYDCSAQTDIPLLECQALVALYNSTGGSSLWVDNTGWLKTSTPCENWLGVMCQNGNVIELNLVFNSLNGTIPPELGNLTALVELDLEDNHLVGSIPAQLGNLTHLWNIYLYNNNLSGSIPAQLGNLANLQTLDAHNNQLSGSIPAELGNLNQLNKLILSINQLSGSIPSQLGNLTLLTDLDLFNNLLSGSLPSELGNMTNLKYLQLGSNPLSGSLPVSLENLSNLSAFAFDKTSLCEPNNSAFQAWLSSIPDLSGTVRCGINISGAVTLGAGGPGLPNVKVSLGSRSTNTAADGSYTFSNVPYGTTAALTPSRTGYTFAPATIQISNLPDDLTGQDFSASVMTFTVSGTITSGGKPLSGVSVSDGSTSATTDPNGVYSLSGVPYGANIDLTPTLAGYFFTPAQLLVNEVESNKTGKNFKATNIYTISGTVTTGSGGLGGVAVTLTTTVPPNPANPTAPTTITYSASTDNTGLYTIPGVPIGTAGKLSAFIPGYSITPTAVTIPSLTANLSGQNFSATLLPVTYSLSGKVTIYDPFNKPTTTVGFAGVTVSFGPYSAVTASDGSYTIGLIAPGTAGVLAAAKTGFTFSPRQRTISAIQSNRSEMNFAAVHVDYTIYGKVYSSTRNLEHVKIHVTANGVPLKDGATNGSGQYFLRNMPNGLTYVITPELTGYTFLPSQVTIPVLASNSSHDFKGTLQYENISGTVSGLGSTTIQIRYGSGKTQLVTTAADGSYAINDLPQSSGYTLTPISPISPIYRFVPTSLMIPAGNGSTTSANFSAALQVVMSGSVTVQGKAIKGVTVSAAGFSTLTDSRGNYSLWVPEGLPLTARAAHPYFTFADSTLAAQSSNFTQSWSTAKVIVTGHVMMNGIGLQAVLLKLSPVVGDIPIMTATDANGVYILTVSDTATPNLTSFVVTPILAGYTFSPRSLAVSPASGTLKNFAAIPNKWNVSGVVTSASKGLSGVEIDATVNGTARKVSTNSSGAYTLTGVPFDASVVINAKKTGFSFTPASISFSMGNAALTGQNFSTN